MKKTLLSLISSLLLTKLVFVLGIIIIMSALITFNPLQSQASGNTDQSEVKDKIVINDNLGFYLEKKANGELVKYESDLFKEIGKLSVAELKEKIKSNDCEERYLATLRYSVIKENNISIDLSYGDCWDDIIRRLIIDLYLLSTNGSNDFEVQIGTGFTIAYLVELEDKVIEYFEKNDLSRYENEHFKGMVLMHVLDSVAKKRKDLIPRIKEIANPSKYINESGLELSAKQLIKNLDKYEKE